MHSSLSETDRKRTVAPFKDDVQAHIVRVVEDGIASGTFAPVAAVDLMTEVMDVAVTRIISDPSVAKVTAAATATFLHDALSGPSASTAN